MLSSAIALLGALALVGAEASASTPTDLNAAIGGVCRPTFVKDGRPSLSGTGFILHAPAFLPRDVLVSAHHLFALASATSSGLPWQDVPRRVTSATCRSFDGARTWRTSAAVAIAGVHAFWRLSSEIKDIAVLPVVSGPATPLQLSPTPAKPGDTVWVLAQVEHALPTDAVAHRAHVIASPGYLAFVYDAPAFDTANISGAPIVDDDGRVVGVNVGAGRSPTGAQLGVGDDLGTLQSALLAARTTP